LRLDSEEWVEGGWNFRKLVENNVPFTIVFTLEADSDPSIQVMALIDSHIKLPLRKH